MFPHGKGANFRPGTFVPAGLRMPARATNESDDEQKNSTLAAFLRDGTRAIKRRQSKPCIRWGFHMFDFRQRFLVLVFRHLAVAAVIQG